MDSPFEYDHLFKFLMVGDSGVGKSSLLLRFTDDTFNPDFISTIGVDFKIKNVKVGDKLCKLQIWDTAGQNRFRAGDNSRQYRGAHGIIIVFDITDQVSFNNVKLWLSEIERYACGSVTKVLVGNKTDLGATRKVSTADAEAFAKQNGMGYFETSAKTGENVDDVFMHVAQTIYKLRVLAPAQKPPEPTSDSSDEEPVKKTKSWKWLRGGKEKVIQQQPAPVTLAQKIRQSDGYRYLRARAGMESLSGKSPIRQSANNKKRVANKQLIQAIDTVLDKNCYDKQKLQELRDIVRGDCSAVSRNTGFGLHSSFHKGNESTSHKHLEALRYVIKILCIKNFVPSETSSSYQSGQ